MGQEQKPEQRSKAPEPVNEPDAVKRLYLFMYRKGVAGVQRSFISASSLEKAEKIGRKYCDNQINHRFIRVEPAIIADESILQENRKTDAA